MQVKDRLQITMTVKGAPAEQWMDGLPRLPLQTADQVLAKRLASKLPHKLSIIDADLDAVYHLSPNVPRSHLLFASSGRLVVAEIKAVGRAARPLEERGMAIAYSSIALVSDIICRQCRRQMATVR